MKKYLVLVFTLFLVFQLQAKVIDSTAPIGSRKNPVPIGGGYSLEVKSSDGKSKFLLTIMVHGIIRGEKAEAVVRSQNMFNPTAPDKHEFVLPMVAVMNMKDYSGEDKYIEIDQDLFEFSDSGYSHKKYYKHEIIINEPLILDAKLYEGSMTTGLMAFFAPIGDECYLYFNGAWFELGSVHYLPK